MAQLDHIPWFTAKKGRYPIHLLKLKLPGTENIGTLCVQCPQLLAQLGALIRQALLDQIIRAAFQRRCCAFCGFSTVGRFRHISAPTQLMPNGRLLG